MANQEQALRNRLYQQQQQFTGQYQPNEYLRQAGSLLRQGPSQPQLWGQAQQHISNILSPGYQAFSPQESDAMFQLMQQRINQAFDQRQQALSEDLNRRGLYRTGLYDAQQQMYVEDPRLQALSQAATDVYLRGQDVTRQQQNLALQAALGLGGQQAGLEQQYLANLLGLGQYTQAQQLQAQLLPFQLGLNLYQAIYGPMALEQERARQSAQQGLWSTIGTVAGFLLPKLFGLPF